MLIIDKKNFPQVTIQKFFFHRTENFYRDKLKSKTKFNEKTFHISSLRRNATA